MKSIRKLLEINAVEFVPAESWGTMSFSSDCIDLSRQGEMSQAKDVVYLYN